jgi:hypothetical protein
MKENQSYATLKYGINIFYRMFVQSVLTYLTSTTLQIKMIARNVDYKLPPLHCGCKM